TSLLKLCFKKLKDYRPNLERQNYLKYSIENSNDEMTQKIAAEHLLTLKINKYASISGELETSFKINDELFGWSTNATLSGSLKF
nr:hypothetical protein [Treponemataceae bacterium]